MAHIDRKTRLAQLRELLSYSPVVAILGPRQCGKTTLAKVVTAKHYFDLENPRDLARLENPQTTLEKLDGLVVIDEVQLKPDLFPLLRYLVDQHSETQYLILGSASEELIQKSAESLAGRIAFLHLHGFDLAEIPEAQAWNDSMLDDWNAGKVKMLVADPRSIGHGLNLQEGGSRIVWYSLTYSSELYEQFNARLARTGQNQITQIFRLICPATIDDAIAEALRDKGDRQSSFLKSLVRNLTKL